MLLIQTKASMLLDTTWEGTYCSFKSVNCFSRVVISSRHSILLLSQSSSSISVHINTWQAWHHLHIHCFSFSNIIISISPPPIQYVIYPPPPVKMYANFHQLPQYHDELMCDRQVYLMNLAAGWYLRPIFPTRAVSIFRHRRANGVLLVCAAAVLLGKIHLHVFVVTFFLFPGVNRHCGVQISRC